MLRWIIIVQHVSSIIICVTNLVIIPVACILWIDWFWENAKRWIVPIQQRAYHEDIWQFGMRLFLSMPDVCDNTSKSCPNKFGFVLVDADVNWPTNAMSSFSSAPCTFKATDTRSRTFVDVNTFFFAKNYYFNCRPLGNSKYVGVLDSHVVYKLGKRRRDETRGKTHTRSVYKMRAMSVHYSPYR